MPKLFIICGHGETDPGACANTFQEAERVRALADKIKHFGGDNVIIGDTKKNWFARYMVNKDNIPKDALVLELHLDSAASTAKGGHVIIYQNYGPDKYDTALAKFISGMFPGRDDIITKRSLRNARLAAENGINYRLLECCFISNISDIKKFNDNIDTIAKGILEVFNLPVNNKKYLVYMNEYTNKIQADNMVEKLKLAGFSAKVKEVV